MNKPELIKKITTANIAYSRGLPFLTDTEYDEYWKQLYDLDPHNPILYHTTTNDPTIPANTSPHIHPIMGTNKAFNMEDLKPFLTRFGNTKLIIEPKYDGCAAVWYRGQDADRLILEGNGQYGRDISHHLPNITNLHKFRNYESVELIIPNILWKEEYGKNIRSTVAGWLAQPAIPHRGLIEMVPHHGTSFLHREYTFDGDYDNLLTILLALYELWSSEYKIDGIMLKVFNESERLVAGDNGSTSNWSIAWKPPIQTKETTITKIEWNVSRTGRIIPTIIYEPITLCNPRS